MPEHSGLLRVWLWCWLSTQFFWSQWRFLLRWWDIVDYWQHSLTAFRLNRAKSVEIIFTDRKRKPPEHHRYRGHSPRHIYQDPWQIICPPASTSAVSSTSARSPSMLWNCCAAMAWVTTRWGTSTRLSSSLSVYASPAWWGQSHRLEI